MHVHAVQVYYEDTDLSGAVYHANFLKYFERAREHLLGPDELVRLWRDAGIGFVVYRCELRFREPAGLATRSRSGRPPGRKASTGRSSGRKRGRRAGRTPRWRGTWNCAASTGVASWSRCPARCGRGWGSGTGGGVVLAAAALRFPSPAWRRAMGIEPTELPLSGRSDRF